MKKLIVLTAGLLLAAVARAGHVGPPDLTNVQGRLLDGSGNPVADGNYTMIFSIWDRAIGGSQLWAETLSVSVTGGLFSAVLGQVHGVQPDFLKGVQPDFAPHLQTAVNGEVLSSRTRIVSSPYSGQASRVTGDIETGPGEILFSGSGVTPELPAGIVFQDTTTGDTIAQYGPGEAVFTGIGGNPDVARYGLTKIDFVVNNPAQSGFIEIRDADAAPGDGLVDRTEYSIAGIKYVDGANDLAQYGPGEAVFSGIGGTPDKPQSIYGLNGIVMTDTTGDTTFQAATDLIQICLPMNVDYMGSLYFTNNTGDTTAMFSPSAVRICEPMLVDYMGSLFFTNSVGDTTVQVDKDFIRVKQGTYTFELFAADGMRRSQGASRTFEVSDTAGCYVGTEAGASKVVKIGSRYKDNSVVAWGRMTAAGSLTNEYGVASAVRNSTGSYTITLDASASLPGNLITTANAELDAAPTTAATARIVYVDQAPAASSNSFNIYITTGAFAAVDNDFMFVCTAR